MAQFYSTLDQNSIIGEIFSKAKKEILIISPFIQLHKHFKDILSGIIEDDKIIIKIVYGKNENDKSKSFNVDDIEFFKKSRNIEIRYESRLHAKYYGNEDMGLSTSMNLWEYSSNNNKEIGILVSNNSLLNLNDKLGQAGVNVDNLFAQLTKLANEIFDKAEVHYKKIPQYSEGVILGYGKKYVTSKVDIDKLNFTKPVTESYREEKKYNSIQTETGHCIKCNCSISLNSTRPLCKDCWGKAIKKTDKFYYCHSCGVTNTSTVEKPVCYNCYKKGVTIH